MYDDGAEWCLHTDHTDARDTSWPLGEHASYQHTSLDQARRKYYHSFQ